MGTSQGLLQTEELAILHSGDHAAVLTVECIARFAAMRAFHAQIMQVDTVTKVKRGNGKSRVCRGMLNSGELGAAVRWTSRQEFSAAWSGGLIEGRVCAQSGHHLH